MATLTEQLRAEWRRVHQAVPSPRLTTDLLRRRIAYRLQERVHGGLPTMMARELDRMGKRWLADKATGQGDAAPGGGTRAEPMLRPGRLVRSWQRRTYSVLVTEHGFAMDDREFSSLSRIAETVTGTRWSGPRFFGLNGHGTPKAVAHG